MFRVFSSPLRTITARCALLSFAFIATSNLAMAFDHKAHDETVMMVSHAWARALPPVVPNGAAYLQLHNMATENDELIGVSASIAKHSMLHESYFDDGKVAMRHIEKLVIEAGKSVEFKPGGFHIMLMGLKKPLNDGTSFELALKFKNAGIIKSVVKVTKAMTKPANAHKHHH